MRAVSYTSKCDSLVEIMRLFVRSRSTVQDDYLAGLKRFISQLYDNYAAGQATGQAHCTVSLVYIAKSFHTIDKY